MTLRDQEVQIAGRVGYFVYREHSFGGDPPVRIAVSQLLVCPQCHKPWAMLRFAGEEICWPRAQFCEQHRSPVGETWHPVPGSLLVEEGWGVIDEQLLAALPDELLKREFDLHIKAYT